MTVVFVSVGFKYILYVCAGFFGLPQVGLAVAAGVDDDGFFTVG